MSIIRARAARGRGAFEPAASLAYGFLPFRVCATLSTGKSTCMRLNAPCRNGSSRRRISLLASPSRSGLTRSSTWSARSTSIGSAGGVATGTPGGPPAVLRRRSRASFIRSSIELAGSAPTEEMPKCTRICSFAFSSCSRKWRAKLSACVAPAPPEMTVNSLSPARASRLSLVSISVASLAMRSSSGSVIVLPACAAAPGAASRRKLIAQSCPPSRRAIE